MSNVCKYLELSTAHISPAAREWLREQAELNDPERWSHCGAWHVAAHSHGWWMYAGDGTEDDSAMHDDLRPIADLSRSKGCDFILFDCDPDKIEGLPVYDWP